ncbi:hypothetical protein L3X38_027863 [Prunus dulcis]|uniref:Transposable element protein n=1 Tax=Prunus dulcis TaxID=3755 RepID=A0AAD4VPL3_PRUDU|nr:hypothetical protein L3X38_027863 [Prunus dulcis]
MPGISPDIISHRLSVNPAVRPVRQKRCAYDPERYEAMRAEVDSSGRLTILHGWTMCVDYTNLNRACPKDSFPLPRIDQLVDATAGHALLSFTNAYSGYNQIFMHPDDQAHTSFITDRGLYCYQRLVNHLFAPLIGNTMEVYVDDILRGIEANPEKIQAILDMIVPKTVKDIQSLTGRDAALTRFISKATDRCAPFFKALKGTK